MYELLRLFRALRWRYRLSQARDDAAYHRSGLRHFAQGLNRANQRIAQIERELIDVDYPAPRTVGKAVDMPV